MGPRSDHWPEGPADPPAWPMTRALLAAVLPSPGQGLPGLGELDLAAFWPRFRAAAPWHLRAALALAGLVLGLLLPLLLRGRPLGALAPADRDAVLARAAALPLLCDLLEVARLVACLAWFEDPVVQAAAEQW